ACRSSIPCGSLLDARNRTLVQTVAYPRPAVTVTAENKPGDDAMTRLPMIAEDKLTEAQRAAIKTVTAGKRAGVRGPSAAMLRSPELCARAAHLGEFCRFETSLPDRLSEMAILITAYNWRAQYEWFAHAPMAQKGGLADDIIEAIRTGKKP